jgi:hypothetical protein
VRRADGFEIVCTNDLALDIGQEEAEEVDFIEREDGADISDDYDDNGVPKYMLCLDRRLGLLEKAHVLERERELGDGGDSDEEGEEILIHYEARVESAEERREATDDNNSLEDKDDNAAILARNNMNMSVDPRMRLPEPPPEWVPPLPKVDKGEPMLSDVDNPGNWQEFTFTAKMENCRYKHYCLPTGAVPVPPKDDGEHEINGCKFYCDSWSENKAARSDAPQDNLFPAGRKGCLDKKL